MNTGACSYCGNFHTAVNESCPLIPRAVQRDLTPVTRDCEHGHLARSCELCELRAALQQAEADRDTGYVRGRVKQITDELDHTMLEAQKSWLKGSNGPIAISAYESLADRCRKAVFDLRAMLMRSDNSRIVISDPEAAAQFREIVERRSNPSQQNDEISRLTEALWVAEAERDELQGRLDRAVKSCVTIKRARLND